MYQLMKSGEKILLEQTLCSQFVLFVVVIKLLSPNRILFILVSVLISYATHPYEIYENKKLYIPILMNEKRLHWFWYTMHSYIKYMKKLIKVKYTYKKLILYYNYRPDKKGVYLDSFCSNTIMQSYRHQVILHITRYYVDS